MTPEKRDRYLRLTASAFLAVGVVAVSVLQFRSHLYGTLRQALQQPVQPTGAPSDSGVAPDSAIDTDGDGLTDRQEIEQYHTSPYIQDSDSDGIDDGKEVKAGTDPNCPTGKTCGTETSAAPQTPLAPTPVQPAAPQTSPPSPAADLSPAEVRAFLLKRGVPQQLLDRVDDATLAQLYHETAAETKNQGAAVQPLPVPAGPTPPKEHLDLIGKLSPQTLRLLFEQSGITKEELSKFSDEQLQQLVNQILKKTP